MSITLQSLGYAFLGGLLPSIVWLYFLLKEDSRNPEPPHLIAFAFFVGMCGVAFAFFAERYLLTATGQGIAVIAALVEEPIKYAMAATFILWRKAVDEPIDYVIYLLTVGLGFAAAENMLFLLAPFSAGQLVLGASFGDIRFLGSTLLHAVASGALGFAFAFSAPLPRSYRTLAAALGLILAIALHAAFDALIMSQSGTVPLAAFFLVWLVAIIFFAVFEVLKYFSYRNQLPTQ